MVDPVKARVGGGGVSARGGATYAFRAPWAGVVRELFVVGAWTGKRTGSLAAVIGAGEGVFWTGTAGVDGTGAGAGVDASVTGVGDGAGVVAGRLTVLVGSAPGVPDEPGVGEPLAAGPVAGLDATVVVVVPPAVFVLVDVDALLAVAVSGASAVIRIMTKTTPAPIARNVMGRKRLSPLTLFPLARSIAPAITLPTVSPPPALLNSARAASA